MVRRLQRLAISLGFFSIVAAALIGWSAYSLSRRRVLENVEANIRNHARACAGFFARLPADVPEPEALARLQDYFQAEEQPFPEAYLCVVGRGGELLLHTLDPSKRGRFVGNGILFDEAGNAPSITLRELVVDLEAPAGRAAGTESVRSRVGTLTSLEGEPQLVACAYARGRGALVAIHVPSKVADARVNEATLPWAIGFAVIVLLAIPLALWGLSRAYAAAAKESRAARLAEQRSAEQLRILHEIDRAILSGGSIDDIVEAALVRLGRIIPYQRASVALLQEKRGVARVLAVHTAGETRMRAGTEVPISDLRDSCIDELKAGRTGVFRDLDAIGELPLFLKRLRAEGIRSLAKIPLMWRGELRGTLNLGFDRVGGPSDQDLELGREVADVIALAVLQAELRSELEHQAAELERRVGERTKELSEVNVELEGYVRSVSHDLRAPLRAVHGFGNMLLEETGTKLGKTEREYVERIVSASGRMVALVRDLLDYSRLGREEIRVRPLDLLHVVEEAQDLLQSELEERDATLEVKEPLHVVLGHHSSLVQTFVNLFSNAAKFVAPKVPPRIRVRTEARGDRVRIWVEDNGIGIAAGDQERMFRMFERLNAAPEYPGTGIGLAIARRAVDRMGGAMGVESTPGKGSRFWIELPRGESPA